MTQEPKLLTEAEALAIWDEAQDRHPGTFVKALRERGLIAPEPVDPLLEEAETLHQAWVAGAIDGRCDAISLALAALRRGMELQREALTRDVVEAAYREAGKAVGGICTTQDYCDALHAALVDRLS